MDTEKALEEFLAALSRSTAQIESDFFSVPFAGMASAVYRERVYCYELYHQLRCALPSDFLYRPAGEVDKASHPLIRHSFKPDLLIHQAGTMTGNLVALEVKPGTAGTEKLGKDLDTLLYLVEEGLYSLGILLVYGGVLRQWSRRLQQAVNTRRSDSLMDKVIVYWHPEPGCEAKPTSWNEISAA